MKNVKRLLAAALCLCLIIGCFAGCHKKDETAVKIGDYTFTAGYYACALVYADTEARQKVDEALTEKGKSTDNVKYLNQKIDGVKYEKWVKDKAIENLKVNAGYMALCKELKLSLSPDDVSTAKSYAENYWSNYGYETIFAENGVSKETFIQYTVDTYYSEIYFDKVYGKEGTNPVTEEQLKETLSKNYFLVYKVEADTSSMTDDEKKAKLDEYNLYLEQYNSGVAFEEIYKAVNGEEAADESSDGGVTINSQEDADKYMNGELTEDDSAKPQDKRAELIGNEETDSVSQYYEDVEKMKVGEAKVIEKENTIALVIRLDETADSYYITSKDETLRKIYASDMSNDAAKKKASDIGVKQVKSAVDLFKVKNIKYPETTTIGG